MTNGWMIEDIYRDNAQQYVLQLQKAEFLEDQYSVTIGLGFRSVTLSDALALSEEGFRLAGRSEVPINAHLERINAPGTLAYFIIEVAE